MMHRTLLYDSHDLEMVTEALLRWREYSEDYKYGS